MHNLETKKEAVIHKKTTGCIAPPHPGMGQLSTWDHGAGQWSVSGQLGWESCPVRAGDRHSRAGSSGHVPVLIDLTTGQPGEDAGR